MKSVEINEYIDPKRNILMVLYWINKKAAVIEGCDTFVIEKITTKNTTYLSKDKTSLKLSYPLMRNLINCIKIKEAVEFQIKIGNENIKALIHENAFFVSTSKSNELEDEIIEKIGLESKKKFPNICSKFYKRLGVT